MLSSKQNLLSPKFHLRRQRKQELLSREMKSLKDNQIKKELKEPSWLREFRQKSLSKSCLIRVGNLLMITSPRSGKISRLRD